MAGSYPRGVPHLRLLRCFFCKMAGRPRSKPGALPRRMASGEKPASQNRRPLAYSRHPWWSKGEKTRSASTAASGLVPRHQMLLQPGSKSVAQSSSDGQSVSVVGGPTDRIRSQLRRLVFSQSTLAVREPSLFAALRHDLRERELELAWEEAARAADSQATVASQLQKIVELLQKVSVKDDQIEELERENADLCVLIGRLHRPPNLLTSSGRAPCGGGGGYIAGRYDPYRQHSPLGYKSPVSFERPLTATAAAA